MEEDANPTIAVAMLQLTQAQMSQIEAEAIAQYPQECCGLLLGIAVPRTATAPIKQTTWVWPAPNAWPPEGLAQSDQALEFLGRPQEHGKGDRFWIAPQDLFRAQKFARSQNWQIIGVYHSHPDHPAVPSECDRQAAWPEYSYLILSIAAPLITKTEDGSSPSVSAKIADRQTWVLNPQSQFEPEQLEISDPGCET